MKDRLDVTCSCCGTRLTVDVGTGEILAEERPKANTEHTFEKAMEEVHGGARKREDSFAKAFERTRNLDDLLSKKFEEAKKKAAKDDSKPRSPFDAD